MKNYIKREKSPKDSRVTYIHLTAKGEELAERIYERHQYFKRLLLLAGVKEENAEQDACLMEHVLCEESYEKLKKYLEKMIGTQEAGQ